MQKIKEKISHALSIPKAVVLDAPLITATGSNELNIENYKSLLEFSDERIRLRTFGGDMVVEGAGLKLEQITTENVVITGEIAAIKYS